MGSCPAPTEPTVVMDGFYSAGFHFWRFLYFNFMIGVVSLVITKNGDYMKAPFFLRYIGESLLLALSYNPAHAFLMGTMGLDPTIASVGAIIASLLVPAGVFFPVYYVQSQLYKMTCDSQGRFPYSGFTDCFIKTLRRQPSALFSGFPIHCAKTILNVVIICLIFSMLKKM